MDRTRPRPRSEPRGAFTGRDRVAVCGYHGWQDWYIGSTARNKGVPECTQELTHGFAYNDLSLLEQMLATIPANSRR